MNDGDNSSSNQTQAEQGSNALRLFIGAGTFVVMGTFVWVYSTKAAEKAEREEQREAEQARLAAEVEVPKPPAATPRNAPPQVQRFMAWAKRTAPMLSKNPAEVVKPSETNCSEDPSDPAGGVCMADLVVHSDDAATYSLNWAQADSSAYKFSAMLHGIPGRVSCGHVGGERLSLDEEAFTAPNSYAERCSVAGDRQALIERIGPVVRLHVFATAYLEHDPDLEQ